jgi:hypothetical protein
MGLPGIMNQFESATDPLTASLIEMQNARSPRVDIKHESKYPKDGIKAAKNRIEEYPDCLRLFGDVLHCIYCNKAMNLRDFMANKLISNPY